MDCHNSVVYNNSGTAKMKFKCAIYRLIGKVPVSPYTDVMSNIMHNKLFLAINMDLGKVILLSPYFDTIRQFVILNGGRSQ